MKLSVVTPVYNVEKYLGKCLDSLLSQGLSPGEYEIIVVNDGSTDSSLQIAEHYRSVHDNIIVLSQANQGISVARNAGLEIARGDYVYFIDPDDFLLKNSLGRLVELAYRHDADMVTFKSRVLREGANDSLTDEECDFGACTPRCMSGLEADAEGLFPLLLSAWFYLVKREFLNAIGLRYIPEMKNSEDTPFTLTVVLNARRVVVAGASVHRYLERSDSIRQDKSKAKNFKKIEYDIKCACYTSEVNNRWKGVRSEAGYKRTQSFLYILVLFAIVRMLRLNLPPSYIKQKIETVKRYGLYPLGEVVPEFGYGGMKFNLLRWFCNRRWLLLTASRLLGVTKRYEGGDI